MPKSYNHRDIEAKWNKYWADKKLFEVDLVSAADKFYCLDMFPYPSGDGLHVGHWRGYVMSDFYARFMRLQGKTVLHPMGFDAFGLPAENAAIKSQSHPKKFTDTAVDNFTKQLKQIGASYDWSKTINTSSPEYYKWTQWLFLQLYKHGFAQKRKSLVNWCPKDQTVLANEQVINGCCERCGSQVTKKELEQWYFLTTKMAEELLEGLEEVEWPEHVKTLQRNWIGRSDGAMVSFAIGDDEKIEVFTTRPDTLFGVTAIVLAPEHPLAKELCAQNGKKGEFEAYYQAVSAKTNVDRSQAKETEKTALFTGASVAHPFTDEKLPVWIADYVLMEYGTGAVMAVPAHDERDYMFAKAHDLPIKQVIATETPLPYSGTGNLVSSSPYDGQPSAEAAERIVADLESTEKGKFTTTYRLRDWLVSRQRYWGAPIPIVYDPDGKPHPVKDEHLPLLLPEDTDILPGGKSPLERSIAYKKRAEELYGVGWHFDTDTLDTFVDSSWYFLRYLSPIDKNQAFDKDLVKKWLPVDLYIGGIEHATLHLLYARFMYRFLVQNGYVKTSQSEPFKKLFNIGMINMHGAKMSKSKGNVVSPDPLIEHYGTDALRGYELFIGPLDVEAEWSPNGINGVHRFLIKLCNITVNDEDILFSRNLFNTYLYKIEQSIATFRLNTVISTAMEFINEAVKAGVDKETMQKFIITLSPVFPYLCEEIWSNLGGTNSVFNTKWPKRFIFQGAENLDRWKLLKNQKFVTTFTVPAGAIPSNTAIENKANSLGIKFNNYFINHENKVINLIVS